MPDLSGDNDALLALAFSKNASLGAYAVLIGAGVSAPSGIPTAWGVLTDLTAQVASSAMTSPTFGRVTSTSPGDLVAK